jgi:hypothetical protein
MPFPSLLHSAYYGQNFTGIVLGTFDVIFRVVLGDAERGARLDPLVNLYNVAIEAGEAMAFAPYVLGGPLRGDGGPSLLLFEAWNDEVVHNECSEGLAAALGVPYLPLTLPATPPGPLPRLVTLPTATAPVSGNVAGGARTAAFSIWHPATHGVIDTLTTTRSYQPGFPPFVMLPANEIVENDVAALHRQYGDFLASHFAGAAVIDDPLAP